ncbi:Cobalt/magnesium transport protein CorA [bioreactor metagenome]|uniref:Cobalt/magnesium transport protein CorA n=1 Tax=bioreactor metagenome TaxID=1076179 RepID=A0A644ZDI3_9ZZZZ|nr:CorA family divalent cation transporter [Candidatus Metalachnospira sp.]
MFYNIENNKLIQAKYSDSDTPEVAVLPFVHDSLPQNILNIPVPVFADAFSRKTFRFESFENFIIICMQIIHIEHYFESTIVYIFIKDNRLILYASNTEDIISFFNKLNTTDNTLSSIYEILYRFFTLQINDDLKHLEGFEKTINKLEEEVFINCDDTSFTKRIINTRKHLMWIKQYYEQFLNILNDIEANENNLFDRASIKQFKILYAKIERLYAKTMNLLEYVSEIRSAYQAQMDISLNNIMKVLTVISAVILPLNLIAAWYGMNFNMPEYSYKYSYPVVIVLSIIVVIACIAYLKKHKWF